MEFAFTEDQLAFRDAVRDLLAKECPPEVVRAAWPEGPDAGGAKPGEGARASADKVDAVWQALADMGVLGIAVPDEHGGLGLSEVDWVLLAEETGYAALPHPFVETVCVAAPLLAATGDSDDVLPRLIDGSNRLGVVATMGGGRGVLRVPWGARGLSPTLVLRCDATPVIDHQFEPGTADPMLPDPEHADGQRLYDQALQQVGTGDTWLALAIAAAGAAGLAGGADESTAAVDGSRDLAVVIEGPVSVVASRDDAERAFDRGALGTAAQLVGLGRRMLDLSVAYAIERKQFGVPIGSQQAVKHHLADAALQLQFAAPAVYRAAWSLSTGADTASRDVSMAKAMASDAARLVGRKALQVHGAIGYTVEYDLHLYFKRAEALARAWGDAAWHRRRVADALGL